ncbi:Na+/solute symporter [Ameyamaea chiangmaiensis NBRC 103196]|uniref:Sodium:solute symporter family protein n=1 Tax=Ameyamaea chiangmaiensis TaxID=442969 RepID=A0A850PG94_9PROT|nr:sodium:solute symporter family protein [Ameyamaea chiangmaiensis]MBS4075877.1 sodium:solute symporter family protein [Ameyamaea chiangmaiensis]NVN41236.1 sodium:solute symporter family protein [Ameyamaea chiangmaiensis]GBQ64069.1 Na+/solute symporter [Ameyamaea chiangmaiensis NBRC 103196]
MAVVVFASLLGVSLGLVLLGRRGHAHASLRDYFVASRQFGSVLLFFLSVGESYSIGGLLGFPGGIYAHGVSFAVWFVGYMLMGMPIGYFLNPQVWRAARRYDALTLPDLFVGRFRHRPLELVVTLSAIVFLVPWGAMQFVGLGVALGGLGIGLSGWPLMAATGVLAFVYVALAGVRAPAYVSILKDILMIVAIVLVAVAVLHRVAPHDLAPGMAVVSGASTLTPEQERFAMSTIVFQGLGLFMSPLNMAFLFTARSARAIRRAQVGMPLYLFMFPALALVAMWARVDGPPLASPNDAFIGTARMLLPEPLIGVVAAGAALSGLVVLVGLCLTIGPLVSRNLLTGLSEAGQKRGAQCVTVGYLVFSVSAAILTTSLITRLNNLTYIGVTQFLPGVLAILFARRANPGAIALGILAGDALGCGLFLTATSVWDINVGLIGLVLNAAIAWGGTMLLPGPAPDERPATC